ncbi:hypothetical protein HQ945_08995 [Phyllobacterium sp. BT25]|uniref:Uncharacterized protein n=1 Tax=Phyllobacterium pellucidum TaxID=2740464 RepID=A0A849VNB2_9HYPH|nr:hypothetical protein [Phyllobacterium pellucidum]NTS31388.1 hypothetical protein [Phyllobacterium pellucidum]
MIIDPDFQDGSETIVTVPMTLNQAEQLQGELSDLACWARGYNAALGNDDYDRRPMGTEGVTALNIALKRAIRKATEGKMK